MQPVLYCISHFVYLSRVGVLGDSSGCRWKKNLFMQIDVCSEFSSNVFDRSSSLVGTVLYCIDYIVIIIFH